MVITESMGHGTSITAPAPWSLVGSGYIVLTKLDPDYVSKKGFLPEHLKGRFTGGIGTVMYMDYLSSDVGPYRELLFIPGMFRLGGRRYYSITKIFVSTEASVVNGRNNWGIPKELAEFETLREGPEEVIRVSRDGRPCAELHFQPLPWSLPVTTSIVPAGRRTLVHHHDGKTYLTTPGARGAVSPARLTHAVMDESSFPDFTRGTLVCTVGVPKFLMTFPEARVTRDPLHARVT